MIGLPRAVTFDCWNTLLYEEQWVTAHGLRVDALARAAGAAGLGIDRDRAGSVFDTAWERHMELWESGVATGALEIARWALGELGIEPRDPVLSLLVRDFEEASHSGRVLAIDGARAALEALAQRGVRLGLVCDTGLTPGRIVRTHLDRAGLLAPLGSTIFSDEWSLPKPNERVFRAALRQLGAEAGESVHVGDLKRTDVAGARAVGMSTVRLRARHDDSSAHTEADHVVADFAELLQLLGIEA